MISRLAKPERFGIFNKEDLWNGISSFTIVPYLCSNEAVEVSFAALNSTSYQTTDAYLLSFYFGGDMIRPACAS
jgi:hypothetical protein